MTPEEQAAAMIADPAWSFATYPTKSISHASTRAADALQKRGASRVEQQAASRYWTEVGIRLCDAGGIMPGQVLSQLADRFGVSI